MEYGLTVWSESIYRPSETSAAARSAVTGQTFIFYNRRVQRIAGCHNEREEMFRIRVFFSGNHSSSITFVKK